MVTKTITGRVQSRAAVGPCIDLFCSVQTAVLSLFRAQTVPLFICMRRAHNWVSFFLQHIVYAKVTFINELLPLLGSVCSELF
jgi:hypothetical protein